MLVTRNSLQPAVTARVLRGRYVVCTLTRNSLLPAVTARVGLGRFVRFRNMNKCIVFKRRIKDLFGYLGLLACSLLSSISGCGSRGHEDKYWEKRKESCPCPDVFIFDFNCFQGLANSFNFIAYSWQQKLCFQVPTKSCCRFKNGKHLIFCLNFPPNFRLNYLRVLGLGFRV